MVSTSAEIVYPAARGLNRWVERARSGEMNVPTGLAAEVTTLVSTRREPALHPALHLAAKLVIMGLVEPADRDRLTEALDVLEAETAYANQNQGSLRLETLTLVRAGCVRLAAALSGAGTSKEPVERWLNAAPSDPVPEVRFALELEAE